MTQRAPRRAARKGRGAGAAFALHGGDSGAPGTRQDQGPHVFEPCRIDWSPESPVKGDWSPMPPGTNFLNADNGLRRFFGLVPAVPYKLKRHPEADPPKTHAQTARRPAALALVGMVRPEKRGSLLEVPTRVRRLAGIQCSTMRLWGLSEPDTESTTATAQRKKVLPEPSPYGCADSRGFSVPRRAYGGCEMNPTGWPPEKRYSQLGSDTGAQTRGNSLAGAFSDRLTGA